MRNFIIICLVWAATLGIGYLIWKEDFNSGMATLGWIGSNVVDFILK